MALEHLQPFSVFETDDVVGEDGFAHRYGWLGLFGRGGGFGADMGQCLVYVTDKQGQAFCLDRIVGDMGGDDPRG